MALKCWITVLLMLCIGNFALADPPAAPSPETRHQVKLAIDRATRYLQTEGESWLKTRRCAACHHVAMSVWAMREAGRQGYAVDEKFLSDTVEGALGSRQKMIASGLLPNPAAPPDPRPLARGVNMGLPFIAVAAQSLPAVSDGQRSSLKLITDEIVTKQLKDGSWEFFLSRPPINENQASDAAWMILTLLGENGADEPDSHRQATTKAIAWLNDASSAETYQDKVLKTLIAIRSREPQTKIETAVQGLIALQRPDGGWAQKADMKGDAFATGQTLYVLALAGRTPDGPEVRRAIDFLLSTQNADGSWPMTSRATPDGRPGSAKLLTPITTAATAWATLGLAEAVPNELHSN
jgi:hypothetical protein